MSPLNSRAALLLGALMGEELERIEQERQRRFQEAYDRMMAEMNRPPEYTEIPITRLRQGMKIVSKFGPNGRVHKSREVVKIIPGSKLGGCAQRNYHIQFKDGGGYECWDRSAIVAIKISEEAPVADSKAGSSGKQGQQSQKGAAGKAAAATRVRLDKMTGGGKR
jgi:hypothetical protein